jgi:hypothetical protein
MRLQALTALAAHARPLITRSLLSTLQPARHCFCPVPANGEKQQGRNVADERAPLAFLETVIAVFDMK